MAFVYAYFFSDFLCFDMSLLLTVTQRGVSNKHCLLSFFHSHRLIMGKVEIDNFFCLTGDIWIFFLQKCLLSIPLRFIQILSKSVNLIGCRGS